MLLWISTAKPFGVNVFLIAAISAALISVGIYCLTRFCRGAQVTPDGGFYLAMRGGGFVPRPYSLRAAAKLTWWNYDVANVAGLLCVAVAMYVHFPQQAWAGILAVATMPAIRRAATWPVLFDLPAIGAAALVTVLPPIAAVAATLIASWYIHERTPSLAVAGCAAVAPDMLWYLVPAMILAAAIQVMRSQRCQPHPQESTIEWLRSPIKSAINKHLTESNGWRSWLLPLGTTSVAFANVGWPLAVAIVAAYGPCLAAQDRARIISQMGFGFVFLSLQILPDYALAIFAMANLFIHTTEV